LPSIRFPPFSLDICIPSATPTPTGLLIGVVDFFFDTNCQNRTGCQLIYQDTAPRCQFLAGNSFKATYLYQHPNPANPEFGYGTVSK
jgi:hypothetical protein